MIVIFDNIAFISEKNSSEAVTEIGVIDSFEAVTEEFQKISRKTPVTEEHPHFNVTMINMNFDQELKQCFE